MSKELSSKKSKQKKNTKKNKIDQLFDNLGLNESSGSLFKENSELDRKFKKTSKNSSKKRKKNLFGDSDDSSKSNKDKKFKKTSKRSDKTKIGNLFGDPDDSSQSNKDKKFKKTSKRSDKTKIGNLFGDSDDSSQFGIKKKSTTKSSRKSKTNSYSSRSESELKELCRERGLNLFGNKTSLIKRLIEYDSKTPESTKKMTNPVQLKKDSFHPLQSGKKSKQSKKLSYNKLQDFNFNFCGKKKQDSPNPYFRPFFLNNQEKELDMLKHSPGIPDTEYLGYKDDPGFYYRTDKYFSGQGNECDYRIPDRSQMKMSTCGGIKKGEGVKLYRYQKLVSDYLSPDTPYRGLLVFHGLGSGKTILSISVLSNFIKKDPDRAIIVITPPGLKQNFEGELNLFEPRDLFGDKIGSEIEMEIKKKVPNDDEQKIKELKKKLFRKNWQERIYLASYESLANRLERRMVSGKLQGKSSIWDEKIQNMCNKKENKHMQTVGVCRGTTLDSSGKKPCPTLAQGKLCNAKGKAFLDSEEFPSLENTLIIIDEAHKLSNPSKDERKFAPVVLRGIQRAKNIRVLLLTATPVDKHPFEIGVLLNLLKDKTSKTRFPEVYDEDKIIDLEKTKKAFEEKFTEQTKEGGYEIINKEEFQNNCKGLVSYYNTELDLTKFAKRIIEPDQKVIMEEELYKKWKKYRNKEIRDLEREKKPYSCRTVTFTQKNGQDKTIDICNNSRKVSNFDETRSQQIKKSIKEIHKHSPKIELAVKNINENFEIGKQFVYSYWDVEGVYALSVALEEKGWKKYTARELYDKYLKFKTTNRMKNYNEIKGKWTPEFKKKLTKQKAFITMGKESKNQWEEALIKEVFNIEDNKLGDLINLVIVNRKYSEGISLKDMRICHILEPPESRSLTEQIIGRSVRDCSHTRLPYKDWNVKIYTYYSTVNDGESITSETQNPLEYSESKFNKQIEEINEKEILRKLYEGPLKTREGELLDEKRVTRCVNNFINCTESLKKEDKEYDQKYNKCLNKKNYCITNSKLGRKEGEIELDTITDKHKYDYIDDIILKKGLKEKYKHTFQQEDEQQRKLRDQIEKQINEDSVSSTSLTLDVLQKIKSKGSLKESKKNNGKAISQALQESSSLNEREREDISEAIKQNLEANQPKTESEYQQEIDDAIQKSIKSDSKKDTVENILQTKLPSKETEQAILKSKKYNFKKGDYCIYTKTGEKVKILEVYNSIPPYYVIRMDDGREIQTIIERLEKMDTLLLSGGGKTKKTIKKSKSDSNEKTIKKRGRPKKTDALKERVEKMGDHKEQMEDIRKTLREQAQKDKLKKEMLKKKRNKWDRIKEEGREQIEKQLDKRLNKKGLRNITDEKKTNINICDTEDEKEKCNSIEFCDWKKTSEGEKCMEIGTDESLKQLAEDRDKISNGFLTLLKETAIDCQVFKNANEKDLKCYRPPIPSNYNIKKQNDFTPQKKKMQTDFLFFNDQDEKVDCSKLQKDECQKKNYLCYYEEPNVFTGLIGADTGCRDLKLNETDCHKLSYSRNECSKQNYLCEWNDKGGIGDLPLILKEDSCEFKYNSKLRENKYAIMFGTKFKNGNLDYSKNENNVYKLKKCTKEVLENQIEQYNNQLNFISEYKEIDYILDKMTELFYNYEFVRDKLTSSIKVIKQNQEKNPNIWSASLKNKFFRMVQTTKLSPPSNNLLILQGKINCSDCPELNLKKLEEKKLLHYVLKINYNDIDNYIRSDESPYDKQEFYIPIQKIMKDGYFNKNIFFMGLQIFINFKLEMNKIISVFLTIDKKINSPQHLKLDADIKELVNIGKDRKKKNKENISCMNSDECQNICDNNLNICI